jgi:hypothetical protein
VVCTSSHCYVYATSNFNTPNILDLKEQPQLVLQCGRGFALLDASSGLQVRACVLLHIAGLTECSVVQAHKPPASLFAPLHGGPVCKRHR